MSDDAPDQRKLEYQEAQRAFRAANDAWNIAGEPISGPVYERLTATHEEFMRAHMNYKGRLDTE